MKTSFGLLDEIKRGKKKREIRGKHKRIQSHAASRTQSYVTQQSKRTKTVLPQNLKQIWIDPHINIPYANT